MSNTNIDVMEQLLKDLAANIGYELIPAPFDTPFEEASLEGLPDIKQFFWTVPASVLKSKEHEGFRKMCIEADIIDTVCITSFPWPFDEDNNVVILMIDVTRRRRGSIKFVDASAWDISDETDMAAVCNMLIHDLFPGEHLLAFQMNENVMDEWVDDLWDEQVRLVPARKIDSSLLPQDYLPKPVAEPGFKYARLDDIFTIIDLEGAMILNNFHRDSVDIDLFGYIVHDNMLELNVPAITVSAYGNLQALKVLPEGTSAIVNLNEKVVLIPHSYVDIDLDYLVEQLCKESTLRQLPFLPFPNAHLEEDHLLGILIEIPENK